MSSAVCHITYQTLILTTLVLYAITILVIEGHASSICTPDEVDPYKKPQDLLEVSPKGLVPGLKMEINGQARALNESTVILEYIMEYADSSSAYRL